MLWSQSICPPILNKVSYLYDEFDLGRISSWTWELVIHWHVIAVTAMRALKETLRIPERMGWNGDPCAPMSWDAWEGVTCHLNQNKTALTIFQM